MGCCGSSEGVEGNGNDAPKPVRIRTEDKYEKIKTLGEGASCKVLAVREVKTGKKFAMKVMEKKQTNNKLLFETEVQILEKLSHKNILELVEYYEDTRTYHILTVLCQGGELFERVKNGQFSEKVASRLAKEMLLALEHCHEKGIVHRDLKPENFVFENKSEDSPMKLIDFGCAKMVLDDEIVDDVAGSPYYVAPEVLREKFKRTGAIWKAADMWSVGVIIYLLLCGFPPFNGDTQDRIFRKIKKGTYRFPKSKGGQQGLSKESKDLIVHLLVMNPADRFTAKQALAHPWIAKDDVASDAPLPDSVVKSLSAFATQCRLKKAVGRVLAKRMIDDDRDNLMAVFKKFDLNGDGHLGPDEIAAMMDHIGQTGGDPTLHMNLMAEMDTDGDGKISPDEFLAHHATQQLSDDRAEIKATFDLFDEDKDGTVSHAEIQKLCDFLKPEVVKSLIQEVDANNDGRINFEEWMEAMTTIDLKVGGNLPNESNETDHDEVHGGVTDTSDNKAATSAKYAV